MSWRKVAVEVEQILPSVGVAEQSCCMDGQSAVLHGDGRSPIVEHMEGHITGARERNWVVGSMLSFGERGRKCTMARWPT